VPDHEANGGSSTVIARFLILIRSLVMLVLVALLALSSPNVKR